MSSSKPIIKRYFLMDKNYEIAQMFLYNVLDRIFGCYASEVFLFKGGKYYG